MPTPDVGGWSSPRSGCMARTAGIRKRPRSEERRTITVAVASHGRSAQSQALTRAVHLSPL
jgi:hypothetical protein